MNQELEINEECAELVPPPLPRALLRFLILCLSTGCQCCTKTQIKSTQKETVRLKSKFHSHAANKTVSWFNKSWTFTVQRTDQNKERECVRVCVPVSSSWY